MKRGFADGETDRGTHICDCRVALVTEKNYFFSCEAPVDLAL